MTSDKEIKMCRRDSQDLCEAFLNTLGIMCTHDFLVLLQSLPLSLLIPQKHSKKIPLIFGAAATKYTLRADKKKAAADIS